MFTDTYRRFGKRILDIALVLPALVILSPLLAVASLAVRLNSTGPILFAQARAGYRGCPFHSYKFRSMFVHEVDPTDMKEVRGDHPLVTPVGRIIRRLKIDELPQLWNILRGDMSWVGPRPTLPEQVAEYTAQQRGRLSVLPGLTGWAQVNGNVELTWDERIQLDLWYIDHLSLWLDLKIIWMTFDVIIRGERPRLEALRAAGIRWNS